jgi:two-component system, NarL family, nitrate/nitrite response regulator NarL
VSSAGDDLAGRVYRVLLAEDHAPTRVDIRETIEQDERFRVVAESADAAGAINGALSERPDLCLLDIKMPGSGIAAAWEITGRLPETRVVMLTAFADDQFLFGALRAGAAGYLLKDMDMTRLTAALADVLEGDVAIPRSLVARIMEEFRDPSARRRAVVPGLDGTKLTSREWEVLNLLGEGLSTAAIARRLTLSQITVRTHVASALRKLRLPDREAAVRLFDQRARRRVVRRVNA